MSVSLLLGECMLAQCAIGASLINDVTLENHEGAFYLRLAQSVDAEWIYVVVE